LGESDGRPADQAAVETMRRCLDAVALDGTIVIDEGERDEAPMRYIVMQSQPARIRFIDTIQIQGERALVRF
jgi:fructose-1,6-bisphosphatase/sedoheptulose 1,7-bisphosphatase-like protein